MPRWLRSLVAVILIVAVADWFGVPRRSWSMFLVVGIAWLTVQIAEELVARLRRKQSN